MGAASGGIAVVIAASMLMLAQVVAAANGKPDLKVEGEAWVLIVLVVGILLAFVGSDGKSGVK